MISLSMHQDKDEYFGLCIFEEDDKLIGSLESIERTDSYSGTFLVKLGLDLGRHFKLHHLKLIDRSKIIHYGFKERLITLRAFQGKYTSWYETFGFKFAKLSHQEACHQAMRELHDMQIPSLFEGCLGDYMLQIRGQDATPRMEKEGVSAYETVYQDIFLICNFLYSTIVKALRRDLVYTYEY